MFDDLIKQLKYLGETGLSLSVKMDEEGYFDRECPNQECLFQFKVFHDDWNDLCKDEAIHCPLCGHVAPRKSWWTKEQLATAKEQAIGHASAIIHNELVTGAREFNRRQRPGLITMSMKVSGGPTQYALVPISAQAALKLKIQCEACSARFAVIGSAFFCPCCGFNSVERTFNDSLKKINTKLDNLNIIRTTLENSADRDAAEITCRSLIESGLNDCVVAFQKFMESLYLRTPNAKKIPMNTFQRLEEGSNFWREVSGEGYEDWLSKEELDELNILFNKRHLLAHTEGFVDQRYLQKTHDALYTAGQRIVVKERDVRRLVFLVEALTSNARSRRKQCGPL